MSKIPKVPGPLYWASAFLLFSLLTDISKADTAINRERLAVDVMEFVLPPRANKLAESMQRAAQSDPDWFANYVRSSQSMQPGQPMPYDSRLGISEAEYEEFLHLSTQMTIQKRAEATIYFENDESGRYRFDGGQSLPDLTGVEIDFRKNQVRSPFGVLQGQTELLDKEDMGLCPEEKVEWVLSAPESNGITGLFARFSVGTASYVGRCFIEYDVKKATVDGRVRISHFLYYDPGFRQPGAQ